LTTVAFGASKTKDTSVFGDLIKQYYQAWGTLDPDQAASLYAKDADLVFFDVAPLQYTHGWKEYRDNFKEHVASTFESLKIAPHDDLKVIRKGHVALVTLTFHVAIKPKQGEPVEFDGRHTLFWEKRGKHWLIVHEHISKPL
jgi:uncharacterized protein (TIGR02246 family)